MNVDRLLGQTGNERDGKLRANRDLCAHPHIRTIGSNVYRRIDRLHWSVGQKGKLVHSIDPCDATRNGDRKSTRLNSSHSSISYAVFCLKKKKLEDKRQSDRPPRLP